MENSLLIGGEHEDGCHCFCDWLDPCPARQALAGVLIMSIAVFFSLRLLGCQFTAQLIQGGQAYRRSNTLDVHFIDTTGSFSRQFMNSFFACMFWMTQGDMSLASPAH
jgi:hypothetical protein